MKNKIAGLITALFILFAVTNSNAQCADIDNQISCQVKFELTIFANSCSICNGTPYTVFVPGNAMVPSPCNPACPGLTPCDMQLTIVAINGIPVTPVSATFSTTIPVSTVGCGGVGVRLVYNPSTGSFEVF